MQITNKTLKLIIGVVVALIIVVVIAFLNMKERLITLNQFNALLAKGKIEKVVTKNEMSLVYTNKARYKIATSLIDFEKIKNIEVEARKDNTNTVLFVLSLCFIFVYLFYRKLNEHLGQNKVEVQTVSTSEEDNFSSKIKPIKSKMKFKDVAGITEAKEELSEIVDFLKFPKKYSNLGVKLPKGLLLVGPPGVGKTLIAKAVAGEAEVPFFYESGASFVQIYVGMGPKKVRELFAKAKQFSPSIIFIDEIDAVGKRRDGSRNEEREATLNQLLTDMDGFLDNSGVFVIAATNKIEVLDEALLRAGRFDRRVYVSLPDLKEREDILSLYLSDKTNSVNIPEIAKLTASFSGAALATLVNEAALNAIKEKKEKIETSDILKVKEKVLIGKKKIVMLSPKEREIQAVYQSAKALCSYWFDVDFEKISLLSTTFKENDKEIVSKSEVLAKIKVLCAGSVATKLIFNEEYSNAKEDKKEIKTLLEEMISMYEMSEDKNKELLLSNEKEIKQLFSKFIETLNTLKDIMLAKEYLTQKELKDTVG